MFENFPYSNFHDLNTDWLINRVKNVETSEANAKESEEAAAGSAAAAAQSATASAQSAQASAQSAEESAQSATASANSATEADNYVASTRAQVNLLQSRVDNIIPSGTQTEGNTELLDIRVGGNGTIYDSAGNAVRNQIKNVSNMISAVGNMDSYVYKPVSFVQGYRHERTNASLVVNSNWVSSTYPVQFYKGQSIITASGYEYVVVDPVPEHNGAYLVTRREKAYIFTADMFGYIEVRAVGNTTPLTPSDVSGNIVSISNNFNIVNRAKKLIKYVSTTGNDSNDGNTASTPYATIGKALSESAETIIIASGTYTETISEYQSYRYQKVKMIADKAILINSSTMHFRYCNVEITGLTIRASDGLTGNFSGMLLLNCTGKLSDCVVDGFPKMGYRLDGSTMTVERCVAKNCGVDGFNGHTITTGYETECTFINCKAFNNGDDGLSIHEAGKMYVIGGEYYNNVQTGLAPHNNCYFEANNVHCYGNGKGIEAINDNAGTGNGNITGCILNNNTSYGIDVKNYTVNLCANGYANNSISNTNAGTGAVINTFSTN